MALRPTATAVSCDVRLRAAGDRHGVDGRPERRTRVMALECQRARLRPPWVRPTSSVLEPQGAADLPVKTERQSWTRPGYEFLQPFFLAQAGNWCNSAKRGCPAQRARHRGASQTTVFNRGDSGLREVRAQIPGGITTSTCDIHSTMRAGIPRVGVALRGDDRADGTHHRQRAAGKST